MKCQCTHEQGDSDCPIHVTCCECGADISSQTVVTERARLAAEVERLRAENEALRIRDDLRIGKCIGCGAAVDGTNVEIESLRAENAELRGRVEAQKIADANETNFHAQHAAQYLELEWFRLREPWVEEAMEGSRGELLRFVQDNPKPGAGT